MRRSILTLLFTVAAAFSLSATTASAQDVGSTTLDICCGGGCCQIAGACVGDGDANPADSCQTCDVSVSQTAWTDTPGCGGTDSGPGGGTDAGPGGGGDDGGCSVSPGQSGSPLGAVVLGLLIATVLTVRRRAR